MSTSGHETEARFTPDRSRATAARDDVRDVWEDRTRVFGRAILLVGKRSKAANIPGGRLTASLGYEQAQPGVRRAQ